MVNRAVWGVILALVGYFGTRWLTGAAENQALIVAGLFFVVAAVLAGPSGDAGRGAARSRVGTGGAPLQGASGAALLASDADGTAADKTKGAGPGPDSDGGGGSGGTGGFGGGFGDGGSGAGGGGGSGGGGGDGGGA